MEDPSGETGLPRRAIAREMRRPADCFDPADTAPFQQSASRGWQRILERVLDGRDEEFVRVRAGYWSLRRFQWRRLWVFALLMADLSRRVSSQRRALAGTGQTDFTVILRFELLARWHIAQLAAYGACALLGGVQWGNSRWAGSAKALARLIPGEAEASAR